MLLDKDNIRKRKPPNQLIIKLKNKNEQLNITKHKIVSKEPDLNFIVADIKDISFEEATLLYETDPNVEYVEPDHYLYANKQGALFIPDDPLFKPHQYAPQITKAPRAWNINQSSPSVELAIVDSGIDITHPDLTGKVIAGPNFVPDGNPSTVDLFGHGTFIAGIAAAVTNNSIGMAGMAPEAKVVSIRVLDSTGSTTASRAAMGIIYAANSNYPVINLSFGSQQRSKVLRDAVNYAWSKGSVVVASVGNFASSVPNYPAFYKHAIAVASTTPADIKSQFSSYGDWADVAAPGSTIWSTASPGSALSPGSELYIASNGTSFACPHVTGLAGILATITNSNKKIRQAIEETCDNIPGTGSLWRFGRINTLRAVKRLNRLK